MKKGMRVGVGLLMWCMMQMAWATVVLNSYEAALPCQTQTDQERQQLLREGLVQVIERISGQTHLEKNTEIKKALDASADYVEQYAYQENILHVKYSAELVNHLINHIGQTAIDHVVENANKTTKNMGKPFLISVEGIRNAADFNQVEEYLRHLRQVIDVNVSQVLGQMAIFEITSQGEDPQQAFSNAVNKDQILLPLPYASQVAQVELAYRLTTLENPQEPLADPPLSAAQPILDDND